MAVTSAGCAAAGGVDSAPAALTPASATEVEDGVRRFMTTVARDVTREGPSAWRHAFAEGPSFFMASDGQLVFPSGAAAAGAIPELVRTIRSIELRWGDDLRVDPLTASLAVVAASYREVRVDAAGKRVDDSGFFTGTTELRDGRWRFRNAHWSDPRPAAP